MEKAEFEAEKSKIHHAAALNGYDKAFVYKILRKHERKKRRRDTTTLKPEKEKVQRVSLPFYPKLTNAIHEVLKEHGFQATYKSGNTLKDRLCALKDKIPQEDRSGIYEIPCKSCPSVYIGQTRRKWKIRLREHKNAVDNLRINESSVASHAIELDHVIDWDRAKLRKCVRKTSHLNAWESMFINTADKPLMNDDDAPITSALFHLTKLKIQ